MQARRQSRESKRSAAPVVELHRTATPSVDMGGLTGLVGYRLRRAQLAVFADFVEALAQLDLRPATYSVLVLVDANPGLNQAAIGDALGIQRTNFVHLVADLEKRGLVSREPSTVDRRAHVLDLTADGRRLLKRAREPVDAHEQRITAALGTTGRRQLLAMLEALDPAPTG